MSQITKTGTVGIRICDGNVSYPYQVLWKHVHYGYFHTIEQAQEYLALVQKALTGEGEMPPPVKEYRKLKGIEVPVKWLNHEYAKDKPKPNKPAKKRGRPLKSDQNRCCRTCKWHGVVNGKREDGGTCCSYGLVEEHNTRIYMHYKRTGIQSLEGFTSDRNCTEWEPNQTN